MEADVEFCENCVTAAGVFELACEADIPASYKAGDGTKQEEHLCLETTRPVAQLEATLLG